MAATIPFTGFTPSVDPTTPGAVLDCRNMVPTLRGMKAAPSALSVGAAPFPSAVTGGAVTELLSGTYRTIVGTATKLYELIGTAENDASGMAYTGGANRWRFAQFGNATIASNGSDPIQQSITTGNFASIAGAPAASIIEVVQGFVFAFDTTDGTLGHRPNGWQCSAIYDQTNWVAAAATQSAFGIIIDTPGKVTAGRALGTNIVAYKKNSMYYGTYQGPPVIWAFNQISPIVGVPCQECVVAIGTLHIFLGTDSQVYQYDGSAVTPIGDEVKDWLFANWSKKFQDRVENYHDKENSLIYWYFVAINATSATPTACLVYNYRTGKFGRADLGIEAAMSFISGQITWDGLGALPGVSTWDTLPVVAYNSSYWSTSNQAPAVVGLDNNLYSLTGAPAASSLTSGWFGDDSAYMYVQGIVPRFLTQPTACTGSAQSVSSLGSAPTPQTLGDMFDGELAADFAARYAQVKLSFTGAHEILGAVPRIQSAGSQ